MTEKVDDAQAQVINSRWLNQMKLTKDDDKKPPKAGWEDAVGTTNFKFNYLTSISGNGNLVNIPGDEYCIYDIDYDKFKTQRDDGTLCKEVIEAYERIHNKLIETCQHSVKTPHGYHYYCKPSQVIIDKLLTKNGNDNKANMGMGIDILYRRCYGLSPGSTVNKTKYIPLKWNKYKPTKLCIEDVYEDFNYLMTHKTKSKKPIKKSKSNKYNELPWLTGNGFLSGLFGERPDKDGFYNEISKWAYGRSKWNHTCSRLKNLVGYKGITDDEAYSAFLWISKRDDGYNKPDSNGLTGEEMVKAQWLATICKEEKLDMIYNSLIKDICDICPLSKALQQIGKNEKDFGNAKFIGEFLSSHLKSYFTGNDQIWYRLNHEQVLWEPFPPAQLNNYISIKWEELCDILLNDCSIGLLIHPNEKIWGKKGSRENNWANKTYPPNYFAKHSLTIEDRWAFQKYCICHQKKLIQMASTYVNMKGKLLGDPLLIDNKFRDDMDLIPHLMPLEDGQNVDLNTGNLVPRKLDDYFTMTMKGTSSQYLTAKKTDDNWFRDQFISQLMGRDEEKIKYLQKVCGFSTLAHQKFHKFFIFNGSGRNGKSKLFWVMTELLANFQTTVSSDLFCQGKENSSEAATPQLMTIKGKRLIKSEEVKDNKTLDVEPIKKITGSTPLTGRKLHQDSQTFTPKCATIMACNQIPEISEAGVAMKERLSIIGFDTFFGSPDSEGWDSDNPHHLLIMPEPELDKQIRDHWGSVIKFFVEGAVDCQITPTMGKMPADWEELTQSYFKTKCPILDFLDSYIEPGHPKNDYIMLGDLVTIYKEEFKLHNKRISQADIEGKLTQAGFKKPVMVNKKLKTDLGIYEKYGSKPKRILGYKFNERAHSMIDPHEEDDNL